MEVQLEEFLTSQRESLEQSLGFQTRARDVCAAGFAAAAYISARLSAPPIDPLRIFPVHSDSKVLTWCDYAVCRP